MSCPEFKERVAQYVGGDLTPEESRPVQDHLRGCGACAELARLLERDREWLASRPPEAAQVDYAAMRQQIRSGIVRERRRRRLLPALLAAAAVVLAVGVTSHRPTPPRVALLVEAARITPAPEVRPSAIAPAARKPRAEELKPELTLEAAIRAFQVLEPPQLPPDGSDSPVEMRIDTRDPHVTIILVQETKGDSR
jgi:anti-sigma factor RsiW